MPRIPSSIKAGKMKLGMNEEIRRAVGKIPPKMRYKAPNYRKLALQWGKDVVRKSNGV